MEEKRKWFLIIFLGLVMIIMIISNSLLGADVHYGKHAGELKNLSIKVVYTDPYFYTPEGLAGYYIGLPMTYEVHITNNSRRTYKHLDVIAIQEYYESGTCDRFWHPYPQYVTYRKGEPLPDDSKQVWQNISLGPNQKIVLSGGYTPPLATCDGLDQTHVIIQHTNRGKVEAAIMYYEPECGVFCPPPPK
ncbi:MAG TPA: hypothetical protein VMW39_06825 [bacterium]|nr:hypothetical protein [bacterium]